MISRKQWNHASAEQIKQLTVRSLGTRLCSSECMPANASQPSSSAQAPGFAHLVNARGLTACCSSAVGLLGNRWYVPQRTCFGACFEDIHRLFSLPRPDRCSPGQNLQAGHVQVPLTIVQLAAWCIDSSIYGAETCAEADLRGQQMAAVAA